MSIILVLCELGLHDSTHNILIVHVYFKLFGQQLWKWELNNNSLMVSISQMLFKILCSLTDHKVLVQQNYTNF